MLAFGRPTTMSRAPADILRPRNTQSMTLKGASPRASVIRVCGADNEAQTLIVDLRSKRHRAFSPPTELAKVADRREDSAVTFAVSDYGLTATTCPTRLSPTSRAIRYVPVVKCLDGRSIPVFDPPFTAESDEFRFRPLRFCPRGRLLGVVENGKQSSYGVLLCDREGWTLENLGVKCAGSSVEYAPTGGYFCISDTKRAGQAIERLDAGQRTPLAIKTPVPELELFGASEDGWVFLRAPDEERSYWVNPVETDSATPLPEGLKPTSVSRSGEFALAAASDSGTLCRLHRIGAHVSIVRICPKSSVAVDGAFVVDSGAVYAVCTDAEGVAFAELCTR